MGDTRKWTLDIYRTAIPMRGFTHAAASRDLAEAVVVRLTDPDGRVGWGETLPREYVTGETIQSVLADLTEYLWPAFREGGLAGLQASRAAGRSGRCVNAAACALELAAVGNEFGAQASRNRIDARVSGVLGSSEPDKTARKLRLMRLFGLRDFKLKLGLGEAIDAANLLAVHRQIGKALVAGKCTLRVDVNGGWTADETPRRVAALKQFNVCVVEQPTYCTAAKLVELARCCDLPLMADESLLTFADADALLTEPQKIWWNIRISKNGGPLAAMALAKRAAEKGVPFVVGCMVGESSILSAAQRRLLQQIPRPRFVEGNYGRFLLADDLTRRSLKFAYAGRLRPLPGPGMGVQIDPEKLSKYGKWVATFT